jgi:hypothetical protein
MWKTPFWESGIFILHWEVRTVPALGLDRVENSRLGNKYTLRDSSIPAFSLF